MRQSFCKFLVFFVCSASLAIEPQLLGPSASEAGIFKMEDSLVEMRFLNLQFDAVLTDMDLYVGWLPEEKDAMKDASQKAIADLEAIKSALKNLTGPDEFIGLKNDMLQFIGALISIYAGVEKKTPEEIQNAFELFYGSYSRYSAQLKETLEERRHLSTNFSQDYDAANEMLGLLRDEHDVEAYKRSAAFKESGDFEQAHLGFSKLIKKHENTSAGDCVKFRLSDLLSDAFMSDSDAARRLSADAYSDSLRLLSEIIDGSRYSPVLYESFYRWRTVTQELEHGMSNISDIPNAEYNKKRWQVIQVINRYLRNNPDDVWAKGQRDLLLDLPNIYRGGEYGNDNLMYYASRFMPKSEVQGAGKWTETPGAAGILPAGKVGMTKGE